MREVERRRIAQEACHGLLEERERFVERQDMIGQRLDSLQELEYPRRMLDHPEDSLVLQTDFLYVIERVNVCINFSRLTAIFGKRNSTSSLMYNPRDDNHQYVLRWISPCTHAGPHTSII
ncbi:uncharacterized protein STEHIDRAFT_161956 [Stereum hirsutum FP-91666 SS1]|uniref:uncharacterized protein n=1 Tax=Stereum hirsutum (strain FP-91666) TaxID=721885 RepID=UPI000444A894|nr:uncharacterized protein STEHIDRAFT_161956 [Stereum hirsutum FP-91666 SS1]EIM80940.1 hypothetical protein STEHIDRAFT_161956 [Stereum hirsutum FP-91666 SS1]